MLPGLTPDLLDQERGWLAAAGGIAADGRLSLAFQTYVVRTPHHTVLVDSCIGNGKHRPTRPDWHEKADSRFMDGLAAVGLSVTRHRLCLLHPPPRRSCGLEHAA